MPSIEVGKRIRKLREKQEYTRTVFSEMIDISPKFLYEIEKGKKGFSAEILIRMSEALSVSCEYIMKGKSKDTGAGEDCSEEYSVEDRSSRKQGNESKRGTSRFL